MGGTADGLQGRFRRDLGGRGPNGCGGCGAFPAMVARAVERRTLLANGRTVAANPARRSIAATGGRLPELAARSMFAAFHVRHGLRLADGGDESGTRSRLAGMTDRPERLPDRLAHG